VQFEIHRALAKFCHLWETVGIARKPNFGKITIKRAKAAVGKPRVNNKKKPSREDFSQDATREG
jgi:hypothetical protein